MGSPKYVNLSAPCSPFYTTYTFPIFSHHQGLLRYSNNFASITLNFETKLCGIKKSHFDSDLNSSVTLEESPVHWFNKNAVTTRMSLCHTDLTEGPSTVERWSSNNQNVTENAHILMHNHYFFCRTRPGRLLNRFPRKKSGVYGRHKIQGWVHIPETKLKVEINLEF